MKEQAFLFTLAVMTLQDYLTLDDTQQIQLVWAIGELVDKRIWHPYKFELFHVNDFYVEVKYRSGEILSYEAFDTDSILLIPYIDKIEIPK